MGDVFSYPLKKKTPNGWIGKFARDIHDSQMVNPSDFL